MHGNHANILSKKNIKQNGKYEILKKTKLY